MGALTRIATGGLAGGGGGGSASYSGSPLSNLRKMFSGRKKSSDSSSGSSSSSSSGSSSSYAGDEDMATYHKGGKVRKTGPARLRKGEHVLTGRQFRKMKGRGRRSKRR